MSLGFRITHIREKKVKVSQTDFAYMLGVSGPSTISNWEKDIREPEISVLIKIAELGKVSLDWLLKGEKADLKNLVRESGVTYVPIEEALTNGKIHYPELPIAADVPAGRNEIKSHDDPEYFKFELDPRRHFVLRVDNEYGYSMSPLLKAGDLVVCHIDKKVIKSGDAVVVRYDGTKGAIKMYVENSEVKDIVVLESINKAETPIILKKKQILDVYKILAFWKK